MSPWLKIFLHPFASDPVVELGKMTLATFGCERRNSATLMAFSLCWRNRNGRVSNP